MFDDEGLSRIDRSTVGELDELGGIVAVIQRSEDQLDAGHNPLGLSEDAIPFDIAPSGAADGTETHFEQIRARADQAMKNADTLLKVAETSSSRLRTNTETEYYLEDQIRAAEKAYELQLIGYYGRPYSDDVGAGKTYPQGYEGPDLLHYMWMDVSQYALDEYEDSFEDLNFHFASLPEWTIDYLKWPGGDWQPLEFDSVKMTNAFWFSTSATGIANKPDDITGTRPAQGSIQTKYGELLAAYATLCMAEDDYKMAYDTMERQLKVCNIMLVKNLALYLLESTSDTMEGIEEIREIFAKKAEAENKERKELAEAMEEAEDDAMADVKSAGTSISIDPSSILGKADALSEIAEDTRAAEKTKRHRMKIAGSVIATVTKTIAELSKLNYEYSENANKERDDLIETMTEFNERYTAYQAAYVATVKAIEACKTEINNAELVLERRELDRRHWVSKIERNRYADMFFRLTRNAALERYSASYDIAQMYVWEAAKAYDYETAGGGFAEGEDICGEIIAARCLGDLSEALDKLDANWLVLKPRLGLNNPQPYATWFSLRGECFRILPGAEGDAAWAKELTKYWTDDIQTNPDFRHYCQRFQSTLGLKDKEPGLIIPFETTIDFAKNLFGNDLAGGDHAYDSTWYATRIAAAGLWFDGYNAKAAGYKGKEQLAKTPVAYLVPIGADRLRAPGLDDDTCLEYNVVDQVLPVPYAIGSECLNDLSWYPTASDGDLGGADSESRIRRHPSFRAYFDPNGGEPTDAALDCTRLIGRSVWNTKWMLVIPAGSMNADRDKALSVFINGSDENRDGKIDLLPVSDIRIGFKTYSNSGN